MTTEAGCFETNRASRRPSASSNSPERSNPCDREMMSKAFAGFTTSPPSATPAGSFLTASLFPSATSPPSARRPASFSATSAGLIFFFFFSSPKFFKNQELSMILAVEIREAGSGSRILDSSRRTSEGNQLGHLNSALLIFLYISIRLESWKGRYPERRTNRITPQDQTVEQTVLSLGLCEGTQAEIRDLQVAILVQEQVLWFEVPVVDPPAMAEVHCAYQLPEELLPALHVLHDEEDLPLGGHDFVQLDDVGVPDEPHHGDLPLDLIHHSYFQHLFLVDHLDCDALRGLEVPRMVDLGEGPLPQQPPLFVLMQQDVALLLHPPTRKKLKISSVFFVQLRSTSFGIVTR
ncbi:unnamed protein product [Spirodela intermedia]|uniref:Uncharacterized protein n=1 Tax=Spirodela intermedia TaxID=51605 RepID=A0A7I8IVI1_SPIIN|nr:unnamed protein product [Spirodela intermedia]CAA6661868.1 unnamed protein product [Spirodela intermedia]